VNFYELFEKHEDEFCKFEHVIKKRSQRADLHAFLLLDELYPQEQDIVSDAEHDKIWLSVTPDDKLTEDHVIELLRCGVMWDRYYESLWMFT